MSCITVPWTKSWVACEYIQSTHWLATGYLIDQAWKNRSSKKSSLETNMRTRTFPSQNACRVKADGMGSTRYRRLPLFELFAIQPWGFIYVRLGHNGFNLCKTVCMDVRLLLFSFCVFSEHWSLGSLYTCIRWSRLMSRGPHRAGIRAILTVGSLS